MEDSSRNQLLIVLAIAVVGTLTACSIVLHEQTVISQDAAHREIFQQWMAQYQIFYEDDEFEYRLGVFKSNLNIIEKHNANPDKTFEMGSNRFTAMTPEEFASRFNGLDSSVKPKSFTTLPTSNLPTSVNWTAEGKVTDVKNQGDCGSCWSFSTCGSMEGLYAITNDTLVSMAEQQLMDCSWLYGNKGCDGGSMIAALEYSAHRGLEANTSYPYTGKTSYICKYKEDEVVFKNKDHTNVQSGSVDQLMAAVAQQPVSIAVQANQPSWQNYKSGIISSDCGQELDHGVLAVGYGTDEKGVEYWLVKNSWGTDWGLEGYLKIERSSANVCGVLTQPTYPTV